MDGATRQWGVCLASGEEKDALLGLNGGKCVETFANRLLEWNASGLVAFPFQNSE